MIARSLASSFGIGTVLLLGGCPDDPTPMTTEADASGSSSTGEADSTTAPLPLDTTASTTEPDPDTGTSTTEPDPETSTGPVDDCGNGMLDADETCDGEELDGATCRSEGFDTGTLACRKDCGDYDRSGCSSYSCGNDSMDPGEACDGTDLGGVTCQGMGFETGTPACLPNCSEIDLGGCGTCGNVIVDGDEVCDGIVLFGQTCESQGFDNGLLGCSADCLQYDTAGCGMCGNGVLDGSESCDGALLDGATCLSIGYDSGTLACDGECLEFDTAGCGTCGNQVIDGDELCDSLALDGETCVSQGFDNGTLACDLTDCNGFVTSGCGICGNGLIDGSESCDGVDLDGQTCASLGLTGGTLACGITCQYDPSACDIPGLPFGSDVGYLGVSLEPGILPCDDISVTGTDTNLFDDDEITVPLGFTFEFYDVPFTQVNISSNGYLYFGPSDGYPLYGECFPGDSFATFDENLLGVFWRDLDPSAAGAVRYQTLGPAGERRFVVQWDVPFYGGFDLLGLRAVLHEAGNIDVCYVDTSGGDEFADDGADASAGIQQDPTVGFGYSCGMPSLTAGLQLMYLPL